MSVWLPEYLEKYLGTWYKVNGVLADAKSKIENNTEVMKEKVQTAKCFKVSAFCSEIFPLDPHNLKRKQHSRASKFSSIAHNWISQP